MHSEHLYVIVKCHKYIVCVFGTVIITLLKVHKQYDLNIWLNLYYGNARSLKPGGVRECWGKKHPCIEVLFVVGHSTSPSFFLFSLCLGEYLSVLL